ADGSAHPELGEPWQVQKVYFNQDLSAKKWITIHEKMIEAGLESPFAEHLEDVKKRDNKRNNWLRTRIPCAEFFPARDRALLSHATQIDREGRRFSASRTAARTDWPTEEFGLALQRTDRRPPIPGVDCQVGDLFAAVPLGDGRSVPDAGRLPDTQEGETEAADRSSEPKSAPGAGPGRSGSEEF